jgi:hypothetical protein
MAMRTFAAKEKQPIAPRPVAKLAVSAPGDRHEQEAERTAEQVTRQPAGALSSNLPGSGAPLPGDVRAYFEPRFGHDFSRVRVHTDGQAARSAEALGAQAYTFGNDVVLGAGQYAPHTGEGRQLLAHELAHVVQQGNGNVAPMIQRRLLVTGSKKDIRAALDLLEPASGFTLQHDPKTNEVTIIASKLKPQSFVLAGQLATIMSDPDRDAEIHVGRDQLGVNFGSFPGSSRALDDDPVQEVRIDQMVALERDVPGAGVAKMAHEIVENYAGHDPEVKQHAWQFAFKEAHSRALEAENAIEGELGNPGARRNTFSVLIDPGKGKPRFMRDIEDRTTHFLVMDVSSEKGIVSNARRVPRIPVAKYTIDGFTAGSNSMPKAALTTIAEIAKEMKKTPTASALVEAFASTGRTADENVRQADLAALELRDMIILVADDQVGVSWHRFETVGHAHKSRNSVEITLERPDM